MTRNDATDADGDGDADGGDGDGPATPLPFLDLGSSMAPVKRLRFDSDATSPAKSNIRGWTPNWSQRSFKEWVKFLHYGSGILITISAYSFLQERIVSKRYDGEIFKGTMFLVLCNRLISIIYSLVMIIAKSENWKMQAAIWKYLVVSFSNMLSTWCQYESLRYVSLILQTMAKTFKMLPVMLVGMLVSRKTHSVQEVGVVSLLTLGLSLFVAGGNVSSQSAETEDSSLYGICLLLAFLMFDSFTSNFQEKLFREDNMSKFNQMLYMNLSSALVCTSVLLCDGMLPYSLKFLDHSSFATHVFMLSLSAAAGQYYIFSMVKSFGALALAAAMNARQVATIFISYLIQTQPLSEVQTLGLIILCLALIAKAACSFFFVKELRAETPGPSPLPSGWPRSRFGFSPFSRLGSFSDKDVEEDEEALELEELEEEEVESLVGKAESGIELPQVIGANGTGHGI